MQAVCSSHCPCGRAMRNGMLRSSTALQHRSLTMMQPLLCARQQQYCMVAAAAAPAAAAAAAAATVRPCFQQDCHTRTAACHQGLIRSSAQQQQQQQRREHQVRCSATKNNKGTSGGSKPQQQQQQQQQAGLGDMDDMEDVILVEASDEDEDENDVDDDGFVDFEEDDDVITDEDADFEDGGDDDGEGLLGIGSDEDPGPEVLTGNVEWGDKALQVAEAVLQQPDNQNLALYLFRVRVPNKTIEIRLDKLDDSYGSPGLEDIERFSRALAQGMEAELGVEAAGEISFEVSSPGAERTLILPQDLLRFKNLPMRVEYMTDVGLLQNVVLNFLELDEVNSSTTWELADVKANQNVKGRGLSKKQRMQRFDVPLESLERVRIYVDF